MKTDSIYLYRLSVFLCVGIPHTTKVSVTQCELSNVE
jgi:hypothetical protein